MAKMDDQICKVKAELKQAKEAKLPKADALQKKLDKLEAARRTAERALPLLTAGMQRARLEWLHRLAQEPARGAQRRDGEDHRVELLVVPELGEVEPDG